MEFLRRLVRRAGNLHSTEKPPATAQRHEGLDPVKALIQMGNQALDRSAWQAACAHFESASLLAPTSVPARIGLAFSLINCGRPEDALPHLEMAAKTQPDNVDAHYMLAGVLRSRGMTEAALGRYRLAVEASPGFELAWLDAAVLMAQGGVNQGLTQWLQQATTAVPGSADLHFLLGNCESTQFHLERAVACYRKALRLNPGHPSALENLALVLRQRGELEESVECLGRLAKLKPGELDPQMAFGRGLQLLSRLEESLEHYQQVVKRFPADAATHAALGSAFTHLNRHEEAVSAYKAALTLDPRNSVAHSGLGVEANEQGQPALAMEHLRRALECDPKAIEPHSSLLFLKSFLSEPADYLNEARRYGEKIESLARPASLGPTEWPQDPAPLRIGMVSGDFRNHPVALFITGILDHLDPTAVHVTAYSANRSEDAFTTRLKSQFSGWTSIAGMSDEAAAHRIREDGIHILIDLAGHTGMNRLPLFGWRAAPVQATWLGFLSGTGLCSMDFLIADCYCAPPEEDDNFVEQVWRLPHSLYCFSPPAEAPAVSSLPAVERGQFTFGSFQRMNKVSERTFDAWSAVLHAVPTSVFRLQNKQMESKEERMRVHTRFRQLGVDPARIQLAGPVRDRTAYLACHGQVDLILDTSPYCGITTTCEALWMGVPTLTCSGRTILSRQGEALLRTVGLDDFVTRSPEEFVAAAVRHASAVAELASLRLSLRDRVRNTPLFDPARFAGELQHAWRQMWNRARSASVDPR